MNYEEKALDIIANNKKIRTQTPPVRGLIRDLLIEVLKQRDKQLKEYLEKKKSEYGIDYIVNPIDMLNEIISEFFKEN